MLEKRMMAGYQYVESLKRPENGLVQYHRYQGSPYEPIKSDNGEEEGDEMFEKSEEIRREAPYFPDDLFDRLPPLLSQQIRPLKSYFRLRPIFANLKIKFTYQGSLVEARLHGLSESTSKRLLTKSVNDQIIEKEDNRCRKVGSRWKNEYQE